MKKSFWKKLKFYLQHVDGIWSVPMAFLLFWFVGITLQHFGGFGVGTYDPGFIQPLFLAIAIVTGATNAAIFLMYFNFRGLYRYFYGEKDQRGNRRNFSKENWLSLKVWQRYLVSFVVFFYYVSAVIIVYLHLV